MGKEKRQKQRYDYGLYLRILTYLKYHRWRCFFIVLVLMGEAATSILGIALLKPVLDLIFVGEPVAQIESEDITPVDHQSEVFPDSGLFVVRVVGGIDDSGEDDFVEASESWIRDHDVREVVVDLRHADIGPAGWAMLSGLAIRSAENPKRITVLTEQEPPPGIASPALLRLLTAPPLSDAARTAVEEVPLPTLEVQAHESLGGIRDRLSAWFTPIAERLQSYAIQSDANQYRVLIGLAVLLLVMAIVRCIFGFYAGYLSGYTCDAVIRRIQDELYTKMMSFEEGFYARMNVGRLMAVIGQDVPIIQPAIETIFLGIIKGPINLIFVLTAMLIISPTLTLWMAIFLPILMLPTLWVATLVRRYSRKVQRRRSNVNVIMHETFAGMRIVRAYGMEREEQRRFSRENWKIFKYKVKSIMASSAAAQITFLISTFGMCVVLLINGYFILQEESISGSDFILFLLLLTAVYRPIKGMTKANSKIIKAMTGAERFFPILDRETTILEKPDAIELPWLSQNIEFRGVTFSYGDEPVLRDVNLDVPAGKVIAIVGSSGSGKTTLVNLVPRFYDPDEGAVLLDGHDLRDASLLSLRRQIAIVTQESILFDDTVRANIAYGCSEMDEERIVEVAQAANAHRFIMEMPEGYDTIIGDRGVRLSGGQRQRLSIARALYKRAPILILDEATSALDTESEREVQAAIDRLIEGHTALVIAHRLSTIIGADEIVVLREGRVVERGKHEELLALGGEYAKFHRLQSEGAAKTTGS
jgi:subfamily B ATP-binding cassette protein MsbA